VLARTKALVVVELLPRAQARAQGGRRQGQMLSREIRLLVIIRCNKTVLFLSFPLCLSRACLGNMIFDKQNGQKVSISYLWQPKSRLSSVSGSQRGRPSPNG
jgi:hypothetical protein